MNEMNIVEMIRKNANRYPERMAYHVNSDDLTEEYSITYKELDRQSDALASWMNDCFKLRRPVVICGHKNPYMLVAFLACSKSGRAYVPVDSSFPPQRIKNIVNQVAPELVLNVDENCLVDNVGVNKFCIVKLNELVNVSKNTPVSVSINDAVSGDRVYYIIFTSGSTGEPKGVQITHDCLRNFVLWAESLGRLESNNFGDSGCVFVNQAPFSFDLSVFDLYLSLCCGGTLWAINKNLINNPDSLLASLRASKGNVLISTPSFVEMLLASRAFDDKLLPFLRKFIFCGETLANKTADVILKRFLDATVINTYGPTESTVAVTSLIISPAIIEKYNPLPIGKPKPGSWIYIVDEKGNYLPDGREGEIVIAGDTVSVGYYKQPRLSGEVFGKVVIDGKEHRLYHTHDKGYFREGNLFYSGRIDRQIKFHGYRIELDDIENNLLKNEEIQQAAVVPKMENGEIKSIMAFIVPKEKYGNKLDKRRQIISRLKTHIPEYMIPKRIEFVEEIPMTINGKVDRNRLKETYDV